MCGCQWLSSHLVGWGGKKKERKVVQVWIWPPTSSDTTRVSMQARRKWVTNTQLCCSAAGPRILLRGAKCVPGKQKIEILNEELMKMRSFPACCPFKFSFHGNGSGEAAWREPGEISAWPPSPLGCQLSHPNCQVFTEVFAIIIYAWNRSDGSSWVPSLRSPEVVSHAVVACS